jgi:hypothetical protein
VRPSPGSRRSSLAARSTSPVRQRRAARRARIERRRGLAAVVAFVGLVAAALVAILTIGCTVEKVVLYNYEARPQPTATARPDAIYPHARTP